MKKSKAVIWGTVLIAAGICWALSSLGLLEINIFFEGWWTLFIIVPCTISLFTSPDKVSSAVGIALGVLLLLSVREIINFDMIMKLVVPAIIVLIGIKLIANAFSEKKTEKIAESLSKNADKLDNVFCLFNGEEVKCDGKVFRGAELNAIFGGIAGSCMMYGIKRGLFSNEAGVGSAPNASASADVSHPVKQGLSQVLSVFIDTILVCSATAFMCMVSGVEPSAALEGAPYVQASLTALLGPVGPIFITVAMILFAFTTMIGNLYYVDRTWFFLFKKTPPKHFLTVYRLVASALILLGAGLSAGLLWDIADVTMGLMALVNVPVIFILGKYAFRALRDYEKQRKEGKDPVFKAADIDLPDQTDYWN